MDPHTAFKPRPDPARQTEGLGLFAQPTPVVPQPAGTTGHTARLNDNRASLAAALAILAKLNARQKLVHRAIMAHGPIDDETLEQRPEFADWAPSTCRKRRCELVDLELVCFHGRKQRPGRSPISTWVSVAPRPEEVR